MMLVAAHVGFCLLVNVCILVLASSSRCHDVDALQRPEDSASTHSLIQTLTARNQFKTSGKGYDGVALLAAGKPHGRGSRGHSRHEKQRGDKAKDRTNDKEVEKKPRSNRTKDSTTDDDRTPASKTKTGVFGLSHFIHIPSRLLLVLVVGFAVMGILIVCQVLFSHDSKAVGPQGDLPDNELSRKNQALSNDAYALAISALIWESYMTAQGYKRVARIVQSLLLVLLNLCVQIYVLMGIKHWICSKAVHDIRRVYDVYEMTMYGNHTTLDYHKDHRGILKYFNPENFKLLDKHLKEDVCSIPFSQPAFFIAALFIWTLTCVDEVKTTVELFASLILRTPRLKSMDEALSQPEDGNDTTESPQVIQGLTFAVKGIICCCVLLPRAGITILLLWLGCRWLAATNNFMDLILNAVALEFILRMKDLVYQTLVPEWNKHDVERIEIAPPTREEPPGYWALIGTLSWASLSLLWVLVYMLFLQTVLPEYRWDVRIVCTDWITDHYGEAHFGV